MQIESSLRITLLLLVLTFTFGCSNSPPRLVGPKIDSGAAAAAVAKYDANGDGAIAGDELSKVPALKASLKRVDTNGDGKVSAEEIDARIAAWQKSGIGLTRPIAWVRQGGRPVPDVEVTFVPEDFLGPNIKPAHGGTDANGSAYVQISNDPDGRGAALGYYRVQLSKKGPDGKEMLPPNCNTETEFGVEVTSEDPGLARLNFDIPSRLRP